jgi:hypothetical protein
MRQSEELLHWKCLTDYIGEKRQNSHHKPAVINLSSDNACWQQHLSYMPEDEIENNQGPSHCKRI